MRIISSGNYKEQMLEEVEPYVARYRTDGFFTRAPGEKIHYERYSRTGAAGNVIISHGFSECALKYHEAANYFLKAGYNVFILDHRGHGRSYRMAEDPSLVHVTDYREMIRDFEYFAERVVRTDEGNLPLYVYAHSMGGAIAASALGDRPEIFRKAVLSSPMLGVNSGKLPLWALRLFVNIKISAGHGADYTVGQAPFNGVRDFEHSTSAGEERYDYYFDHCLEDVSARTWGSSYIAARELDRLAKYAMNRKRNERITTPVLLFSAGADHMVTERAQRVFISRITDGRFEKIPGVKHEIYTAKDSIIQAYWDEILEFFAE